MVFRQPIPVKEADFAHREVRRASHGCSVLDTAGKASLCGIKPE